MSKQENNLRKTQTNNLRKERQIESLDRLGGVHWNDSCGAGRKSKYPIQVRPDDQAQGGMSQIIPLTDH